MESRKSNKIILALVGLVMTMSFFLGRLSTKPTVVNTPSVDSLNTRLETMYDSLNYYQYINDSILNENTALIQERDTLRVAIDGTLAVINGLTDPVVTQETVTEALKWIEIYNDSLLYH
jgi:hypothetical protein